MATIITGASSGIGFELTKLCSRHGQDVVMIANNKKRLDEARKNIETVAKGRVSSIAADLSDLEAPAYIIKKLHKDGVPIDILINNAGFSARGEFWNIPLDAHIQMMRVNMTALTHLTYLVLPQMLEINRGKILNVASTAAYAPGPYMAVYYATKAYVLSFSQALGSELQQKESSNITVTALCPGPTETNFAKRAGATDTPLFQNMRVLKPEKVAKIGFDGMMKGKDVVVPGTANKFWATGARFSPRKITSKIISFLQKK